MTRRALLWTAAALLGIVLSAAVAWATSRLAAQRIGLSSEPLSVLSGLAPQRGNPGPRVTQTGHPDRRESGHPAGAAQSTTRSQVTLPSTRSGTTVAPAGSAPAATSTSPAPSPSSTAISSASPPNQNQSATTQQRSSSSQRQDDSGGRQGGGQGGGQGGSSGQRDD
jgi:hypothetical protein